MVKLRRRFHARVTSNTAFAANLSEMIIQHLQSVRLESGELNVKLARFSAKRGAPAGNGNRLSHGGRTRETDQLQKNVREHIKDSAAAISAVKELWN